jgi:hypothetical protein
MKATPNVTTQKMATLQVASLSLFSLIVVRLQPLKLLQARYKITAVH